MDNIQLATMSDIPQLPCYDLNNNETDVVEDDSLEYILDTWVFTFLTGLYDYV